MKKALIIIAAVFCGVALLALVGAAIEEPAVIPPEVAVLTSEEQEVYEFIDVAIHDLDALYSDFADACGDVDIDAMVDCGRDWRELSDEWTAIPVVGGKVEDLEYAYDEAVQAVQKSMKDAVRIFDGRTVTDESLQRHIAAVFVAIAECEDELAAVEDKTSY